ncbi:MAG: competence/damage-inducible protein A [bacterium]|nr:competence/damage-inducible protein A [bacterium]
MRAILISIGTELTSGATVDTNAAWLARRLAELGATVRRHVTVGDDAEAIAREIAQAADGPIAADVVIVTGGLGPTEDDLTRQALAQALEVPLRSDPSLLQQVQDFFASRGYRWSTSNARQALLPEGARALTNRWGTAPGIEALVGHSAVYCLPGVPREMMAMYEHYVEPNLQQVVGAGVIVTRSLFCYGLGESKVGEQIADLMGPERPVSVGTTAADGIIGLRLTATADSRTAAEAMLHEVQADIRQRLGKLVFGTGGDTLETVVADLLVRNGSTVSTAESCTGGWLAKRLTDVPGSSAYFIRGLITYANSAKVDLLGVPAESIESQGAVSAEVAEAMAAGCRSRSKTDYALAVTGIAGPTGGSTEKPVGLVFVALADETGCRAQRLTFGDHLTRESIRRRSVDAALNLLRLTLLEV